MDSLPVGNCRCLMRTGTTLNNVLVASLVGRWRVERMRLLSKYAAFHVLMVRCSTKSAIERAMERSLWKKSRLRTVPAQSACMAIAERGGLLELQGSADTVSMHGYC